MRVYSVRPLPPASRPRRAAGAYSLVTAWSFCATVGLANNRNFQSRLLVTPCGVITIVDKNNNCIPFTVRKNLFDCPYSFKNTQGKTVTLHTDTNYEIVIKTSDLEKGVMHQIRLKGTQLVYGDSDEHTECISGCSNGYCIAIGTWLPNDDEKLQQAEEYSEKMGFLKYNSIIEPPQYDTSRFKEYDVEMSDDCSGYSFYLMCTE